MRMKTFLKGYNLWNAVKQDVEPQVARENASAAQVKQYEEEIAKKFKVLSFIQSTVSEDIYSRIMECETVKAAWTKFRNPKNCLSNRSEGYEGVVLFCVKTR
ncbi:hypothetical protein POUND7_008534 [Theobroma cacao]